METANLSFFEKIRFREKLAFGLANWGNIPVLIVTGSFLLIFYTDVVGLSPAVCATLFLIARIFDGITDPAVGYLIDHLPAGKRGRFRPVLAVGALLTSINFLLIFLGPYMASGFKLGIAYITYLLLGVLFDLMNISLNSLLPVMTANTKERTSLSTIKGGFYIIGVMGLNIAAPYIVDDTSEPGGYIALIVAVSIIIALFSFIGAAGVKERIKPTVEKKYGTSDYFKIITQRPVLAQSICTLFMATASYMVQASNLYYYTYIIGDIIILSVAAIVRMLVLFPGMFVSGILAPRLGKKTVFVFSLLLNGLGPMLRILNVTNIQLLMASTALGGLGYGLMMPLIYGMQADNTDYVEISLGYRTEAAIASLASFITKFAMGVGGAIPGYLLAWAGYNAALNLQSTTTNNTIIFCVCIAPVILMGLGAIIMGMFYPLTKQKLEQQEQEMRRRHIALQL
jgi:GPH family glycoside/pentoside/hexuronide:cation symporter/glucuronide carrier protein